jgi:hypothetical protein
MSAFNITPENKAALLAQRIEQLNLEGYQHELNLKQFEAIGAGDSEEANNARQAIVTIQTALTVCAEELEN